MNAERNYWLTVSPLVAYVLAFLFVLGFYQLGWSYLYPPLGGEVLVFLLLTSLTCLVLAAIIRILPPGRSVHSSSYWGSVNSRRLMIVIVTLVLLEFAHAGGVPIALMLASDSYDYREFGIPTLHVILFGVYSFMTVHLFYLYLSEGGRRYLMYSISLLLINILIVNRGAFLQSMIAMLVMYVTVRGIRARALATVVAVVVAFVIMFGLIGDARMKAMGMDPDTSISVIGDATDKYPADALGSGPFWIYLYASSPLANWQLNIAKNNSIDAPFSKFFALEVVPDFISKRLVSDDARKESPELVASAMTVSSAFGRAFYFKGWLGCTVIFSVFLFYYLLARLLLSGTEYYVSGLALLASGASLMIFFNMMIFAGLIGPLFVALTFRFIFLRRGGE